MSDEVVSVVKVKQARRTTPLTEAQKLGIIATRGFPVMCSRQNAQNRAEVFVVEYCKDQNGSAAWRRTIFPAECTSTAARNYGSQWLKIPEVGREIKRRLSGQLTLQDITPERIMKETARLAFSDVAKLTKQMPVTDGDGNQLLDEAGQPRWYEVAKDFSELDEDTRRSIVQVEFKHGGKNLKLADKQAALTLLAKIQGMVVDRKAISADASPILQADTVDVNESTDLDLIEMVLTDGVAEMVDLDDVTEDDEDD